MSIYEFSDYKRYLKKWLEAQPKQGRGLIRKMADHLRMSSTMMSLSTGLYVYDNYINYLVLSKGGVLPACREVERNEIEIPLSAHHGIKLI